MTDQGKEAIRSKARQFLPIWSDTFANLWLTAETAALAAATEPADPDFSTDAGQQAGIKFGASLAGNLIWAAENLVPEAKAGILLAKGVQGAVATIGGVPPTTTPGAMPSFKVAVSEALTKGRDSLADRGKDIVIDVADECAMENVADPENQKKRLWSKLFNGPFNQADPIRNAAAAYLAKAAADFVAQWQANKEDPKVKEVGGQRADARIEKEGYPWGLKILHFVTSDDTPELSYKLGIIQEETLKYAAETFAPTMPKV